MSKDTNEYLSLLYEALGEPIGLLVRTTDRERARQKFYAARKASNDESLAQLQIRVSPFVEENEENDLIIVKGKITMATPSLKGLDL